MNLNLKKKIAIIILPLIFFGIATTVIFNKNVVESKLPLKICLGEFAFCGASSTKPTGNKMIVNGKEFYEGEAICPVMTGPSIANMELMNNSCDAPDGTVKLFGLYFGITPMCLKHQCGTFRLRLIVNL